MRVLSLTAGAAGMYCGTCMRDNALASELIAEGHDVLLVPFYTPTLTDEANVSHPRVFFGGISVYLQQHFPLFRSLPAVFDRLWDSNWMLKLATSGSIPTDPKMLGEITVSTLQGEDGPLRKEVTKLLDWLVTEPAPDVIDIPYSLLIGLARPLKRALNRPVCCTLQGEDLFLEGLKEPWRTQCLDLIRSNLQHVDRFIAVSQYYAGFMSRYLSIPSDRIEVVPLGINLAGHEVAERPANSPLRIGYFARVAPEKGLHILVEAYRLLREAGTANCTLEAAGYLPEEHKKYLADVQSKLRRAGLESEFHYHGAPDREGKIQFLRSLDVFSVPSTYDEPKGIFLLEAMANGVPVIQPRRGAYPEIISRTGGGLLVEPDDPQSLAAALRTLLENTEERRRLGREGRLGVERNATIRSMAERTLEVYGSVTAQSPAHLGSGA